MNLSPGYPPFSVEHSILMTALPEPKHPTAPYSTLPTKFVHYRPVKRGYQKGRFTSNKNRNSSRGCYFASSYHQPDSKLKSRAKSAFPHPNTFFDYIPAEVRNTIYERLLEGLVVKIDDLVYVYSAGKDSSTSVYQAKPMRNAQNHANMVNKLERPATNFMCISRQFFHEIREILHRDMIVTFSRRWDFLNACGTGSLYLHHTFPIHNTELLLFPPSSNIFSKIRQLELDLCKSSDFGHRIVTVEVERVTSLLLKMVATNLPGLRSLTLQLNDISRISFVEGVFLPESSFVESLLAIKQIKMIHLVPGRGWTGKGPRQNVFQHNLAAFELLMQRHFSGVRVIHLHEVAVGNRWVRLANIGRLMLSVKDTGTPTDVRSYGHAMTLIRHKIYAIEHGARR